MKLLLNGMKLIDHTAKGNYACLEVQFQIPFGATGVSLLAACRGAARGTGFAHRPTEKERTVPGPRTETAMSSCCNDKSCALEQLHARQSAVLRIVLVLNALMFVVELGAGLQAGSVSLLADSLDMLGDALVYGFSLWVVGRGLAWKARAAASKAGVMAMFGLFVLAELIFKLLFPQPPGFATMGAVGGLALAVNALCFGLLWRHRTEDINMRSVWLCSRNDLYANVAVLLAALVVWQTGSAWADLIVGAFICILFLHSAWGVATEARRELRAARDPLRVQSA